MFWWILRHLTLVWTAAMDAIHGVEDLVAYAKLTAADKKQAALDRIMTALHPITQYLPASMQTHLEGFIGELIDAAVTELNRIDPKWAGNHAVQPSMSKVIATAAIKYKPADVTVPPAPDPLPGPDPIPVLLEKATNAAEEKVLADAKAEGQTLTDPPPASELTVPTSEPAPTPGTTAKPVAPAPVQHVASGELENVPHVAPAQPGAVPDAAPSQPSSPEPSNPEPSAPSSDTPTPGTTGKPVDPNAHGQAEKAQHSEDQGKQAPSSDTPTPGTTGKPVDPPKGR